MKPSLPPFGFSLMPFFVFLLGLPFGQFIYPLSRYPRTYEKENQKFCRSTFFCYQNAINEYIIQTIDNISILGKSIRLSLDIVIVHNSDEKGVGDV